MTTQEGKERALKTIRDLGAKKSEDEEKYLLDAVCRAVMRNPSKEAIVLVDEILEDIKKFISDKTDESVDWMLSNASESRGYFKDVNSLRKYFNGDLSKELSSTKVAILDGLLSTMSYGVHAVIEHGDENKVKNQMQQSLKALYTKGGEPKYIGEAFPERGLTLSAGRDKRLGKESSVLPATFVQNENNSAGVYAGKCAPDRAVSVASGFESGKGMTDKPNSDPELQKFSYERKLKADNQFLFNDDYHFLAGETGVPLVGHVSGTTPENLAIAAGLLLVGKQSNELTAESKEELNGKMECLAGLIAVSFQRSRFHSPPEVLVGLRHFLDPKDTEHLEVTTPEEMRDLFMDSIDLIAKASSSQLKEAIEILVEDIAVNASMKLDDEFEVLAESKDSKFFDKTKFIQEWFNGIKHIDGNEPSEGLEVNSNDGNLGILTSNLGKRSDSPTDSQLESEQGASASEGSISSGSEYSHPDPRPKQNKP